MIKSIALLFSFSLVSQAATVATVPVYAGGKGGNPEDTFTPYITNGGVGSGTRIGMATEQETQYTNPRVIAGTSNDIVWEVPSAGTITLTYYLDNTVNAPFQVGVQGLYDATLGVAGNASDVQTALSDFNALSGLTVTTTPNPLPASLNSGSGGAGAPAVLFTTTYTIEEGSDAIGKKVAIGFYSTWTGKGAYIFGKESGPNDVVIDFVPIPEVSTAALLGFAGLGLLRRRR